MTVDDAYFSYWGVICMHQMQTSVDPKLFEVICDIHSHVTMLHVQTGLTVSQNVKNFGQPQTELHSIIEFV